MARTKKVISASVNPEQHDLLKRSTKIRGLKSTSELLRTMIDEYLCDSTITLTDFNKEALEEAAQHKDVSVASVANDYLKRYITPDDKGRSVVTGEVLPIILKVPSELRGNRAELAKWLQTRAKFILDKLAQ